MQIFTTSSEGIIEITAGQELNENAQCLENISTFSKKNFQEKFLIQVFWIFKIFSQTLENCFKHQRLTKNEENMELFWQRAEP